MQKSSLPNDFEWGSRTERNIDNSENHLRLRAVLLIHFVKSDGKAGSHKAPRGSRKELHRRAERNIRKKFHDCRSEYISLAEADVFEYAFKLGMQISIEALIE